MFQGWERADWLAFIGILVALGVPLLGAFAALARPLFKAVLYLRDIDGSLKELRREVAQVREWTAAHGAEHRSLADVLDKVSETLSAHESMLREHGEALRIHAALLREEGR